MRDRQRGQVEIVSEKHQPLIGFGVVETHAPQRIGIDTRRFIIAQDHGVVGERAALQRHGARVAPVELHVLLAAHDSSAVFAWSANGCGESREELPIPTELQQALDTLPLPKDADPGCPYSFWNGKMSERAVIRNARRTMILVKGGTEQDIAGILGISPAIVRKHYARWTQAWQERISALIAAASGHELGH